MIELALWLAFICGPEPRPLPNAIPAETFTRLRSDGKPTSWNSRPNRIARNWRGSGGLLFCDDPECLWCAEYVYGFDVWPNPPIRIRR